MASENLTDIVSNAMRMSFHLGERYGDQANSDRYSDAERSTKTREKFQEFMKTTLEKVAKHSSP